MLFEYITGKILDECIDYAKDILSTSGSILKSSNNDVQEAISHHINSTINWAEEISFRDSKEIKTISNVYIPLDMFLYPRRLKIEDSEKIEQLPLHKIFDEHAYHYILLGQPGAGKTTSIKHIAYTLITDGKKLTQFNFPIVIKLREIKSGLEEKNSRDISDINSIIIKRIYSILGINIVFDEKLQNLDSHDEKLYLMERIVVRFLEDLKVLLILDGFDELSTGYKKHVISEIRKLATQLCRSSLIVTSRTGEFSYHIENASTYEICPLKKPQIDTFAKKWLGTKKAEEFLSQVEKSPFHDTIIRPLTLAHLCAIYERINKIPDKPKTIYKKIVNLLLEEWDEQQSVSRVTKYAGFEIDRKLEFLCRLAYELTLNTQSAIFSRDNFLDAYKEICVDFDLSENESQKIVDEIESHNGLFVQAGYSAYEFSHKSIQEYLTAQYIVGLPRLPSINIILKIPHEIAISVSISSNSSDYFNELILNRLTKTQVNHEYIKIFVNRLLQEKPEFNSSDTTRLALCALYSLYLQSKETEKSSSKSFDTIDHDFDEFFEELVKRNITDSLLEYYEVSTRTVNILGLNVYILENKKTMYGIDLPKQLYAKSIFLDEKPA